ncbi:MAG: class I SAM-dependent methyltransferase [Desulfobacteraceae bacterium]|nr:class I SAM-dependent methyltransferase [Desulfobacteraceae bacterium]
MSSDNILKAYEKRKQQQAVAEYFFTYNSFAYLFMQQERERVMLKLLYKFGFHSLANMRILDIGCGNGNGLREFLQWGSVPKNLSGIDIRPEPIERASLLNPTIDYRCTDATNLPWEAESFDLCLCYTVFSSVPDDSAQEAIAEEIRRILSPGGILVWYDFKYNNPRNTDVRGVAKQRIKELFPDFKILALRKVTLLPPLAHRLGILTPLLYPALSSSPFLRTHYLGILQKPFLKI